MTRQLIKLVIFTGLMLFITEQVLHVLLQASSYLYFGSWIGWQGCIAMQYMNPIVKNSKHPLKGDFLYAIERILKLSVPNLYVWLCMFYCFFHLWYGSLLRWYHNMSIHSLNFYYFYYAIHWAMIRNRNGKRLICYVLFPSYACIVFPVQGFVFLNLYALWFCMCNQFHDGILVVRHALYV